MSPETLSRRVGERKRTIAMQACRELLEFADTDITPANVAGLKAMLRQVLKKATSYGEFRGIDPGWRRSVRPISEKQMCRWQRDLRRALNQLVPSARSTFHVGSFTIPGLPRRKGEARRRDIVARYRLDSTRGVVKVVERPTGDANAEFWLCVILLFERFGSAMHRCQHCERVFLGRGRYCSDRCRVDAWDERHPARAKARRLDWYHKTRGELETPRSVIG